MEGAALIERGYHLQRRLFPHLIYAGYMVFFFPIYMVLRHRLGNIGLSSRAKSMTAWERLCPQT